MIARECQNCIRSCDLVARKLPSGRNIEETTTQIMKMYCEKAGRKEKNGNHKPSPPFTFEQTADYFAFQSKWQRTMERDNRNESDTAHIDGSPLFCHSEGWKR